jgi:dimethylhistidine N-methyltransferase
MSSSNTFRQDVIRGLDRPQKELPAKYLYDERGSQLFDQICELEEYYLTRCELSILRSHAQAIVARLVGNGGGVHVIEYGSGSSLKTRVLLDHLPRSTTTYVPVDISREHLQRSADDIRAAYPDLKVEPVCADFTRPFSLPSVGQRRVVYFSGSTIGNFTWQAARNLLGGIAHLIGEHGALLIGVDLKKEKKILERAYNDSRGVTAAFNLNVLSHINRELEADFDLSGFRHRAFYNAEKGRIEMHLVSLHEQEVRVDGRTFAFQVGETIHTENSHKFSLEDFRDLACSTGLSVEQVWTDSDQLFSLQYLDRM